MPSLTLQQELWLLARGGAQSFYRTLQTFAVIAILVAGAFGIWSLRPIPAYSSEDVTSGSALDATFRMENTSDWFALSDLRIGCVLAQVRATGMPPTLIEATDVDFPDGTVGHLEPGQSATFKCPFRALIGHSINDDPDIALRAEIYFRSEYAVPLLETLRITNDSPLFIVNTRLLPPRWTGKSED